MFILLDFLVPIAAIFMAYLGFVFVMELSLVQALVIASLYLGASILLFFTLWVYYLACMNLKRVNDAGQLISRGYKFGMIVLFIGLLIDLIVNIFVMSFIMLELPREFTVTARLQRHHKEDASGPMAKWRLAVVHWFEPILDPFDPSGDHA